jgi:hypothetical protein
MSTARYYPDGYTPDVIDDLLAELGTELGTAVTVTLPTSALLDGSAAYRALRRAEKRALTGAVRTLPVRPAVVSQDGEAA